MSQKDNPKTVAFMETLASRRSVMPKRMGQPGPTLDQIHFLVDAALTAPDHNQLKPWRLLIIPQEKRDQLAEAFVAGKTRRRGDIGEDERLREFDKAASTPVMIALISSVSSDDPHVPAEEQYISIGASLQNILLSAHAMGYGAIILSGNRVRDQEAKDLLGLSKDEKLIGFICMGTIVKAPKEIIRPKYQDVLSVW